MPQIFAALRAAVHDVMVGMLCLWRSIALCPLWLRRARRARRARPILRRFRDETDRNR